jgi:hypothetical protein
MSIADIGEIGWIYSHFNSHQQGEIRQALRFSGADFLLLTKRILPLLLMIDSYIPLTRIHRLSFDNYIYGFRYPINGIELQLLFPNGLRPITIGIVTISHRINIKIESAGNRFLSEIVNLLIYLVRQMGGGSDPTQMSADILKIILNFLNNNKIPFLITPIWNGVEIKI